MHQMAEAIVRTLRDAGYQACIVGGAVRDIVLGLPPKDFDVATSALPHEIQAIFPDAPHVGKSYGIVLVGDVEVAPFRRDVACFGRQAEVEFVDSPDVDASRRDFTMNAMRIGADGEIVDPFGGCSDLEQGIIRFVGDPQARLREDFLRGLRAIRFQARFGFELHPATREAIDDHAPSVAACDANRILGSEQEPGELRRAGASFGPMVRCLFDTRVGAHIFPEVEALRGIPQDPVFHPEGDVFEHTMRIVEALGPDVPFEVRLAALLHDIGKVSTTQPDTEGRIRSIGHEDVGETLADAVLLRLKASNALRRTVAFLVRRHMVPHGTMSKRTVRRLVKEAGSVELVGSLFVLAQADSLASNADLSAVRENLSIAESVFAEPLEQKLEPVLSGRDLMEVFGLPQGPQIGAVLRALTEHQMGADSPLGRDEAIAFVRSIL